MSPRQVPEAAPGCRMPPPCVAARAWPPQPLCPAGSLLGPVPQGAAPGGRICHESGQGSPRQDSPTQKLIRRVPEGSPPPSPNSLQGQEGTQKDVQTPQTHKESSTKGSSLPKLWGLNDIPEKDHLQTQGGPVDIPEKAPTSPDSLGTTRGCNKGLPLLRLTGGR